MTESPLQRAGVELLDFGRLRLVEVAAPEVPPDERRAMDRVWGEAARANPRLFGELDRIAFVGSPAESASLDGPRVDFLDPVLRAHAGES